MGGALRKNRRRRESIGEVVYIPEGEESLDLGFMDPYISAPASWLPNARPEAIFVPPLPLVPPPMPPPLPAARPVGHLLLKASLQITVEGVESDETLLGAAAVNVIFDEILGRLSVVDLCRCQRVCKEWYAIVRHNDLWRTALANDSRRWPRAARDRADALLSRFLPGAPPERVKWKRVCFELNVLRECKRCGKHFRLSWATPCKSHRPGAVWDLFEDDTFPCAFPFWFFSLLLIRGACINSHTKTSAGVHWSCCGARQRDAPGCVEGGEHEDDSTGNYISALLKSG